MAKSGKRHAPPSSFEVTAPKSIAPLMQAFHVDSEEIASSLILERQGQFLDTMSLA